MFFRLALIGALAASLGLAACGRKGPLDPPPSAVPTAGKQAPANPAIRSPFEKSSDGSDNNAGPQVPDKPFVLDPLLN
jgi:predicted small lipoprotein YifL